MALKNTPKFLLLIWLMIIWLPSGPTDIFITPFIINIVGFEMYILLSILMVYFLYNWIEGKTIKDKIQTVEHEIKLFIKIYF